MKLLLDVLNKKHTDRTPIWLMRQAGRYLPEYKEIRKNFSSFIEFCLTKDAACEVTIQPLRRFNLDAAIIFSDILILPYALGMDVDFLESFGPIINNLLNKNNIKGFLKSFNKDTRNIFRNVYSAISLVKEELNKNFPHSALVGFAGSPWTVACYMIDSRVSKDFADIRGLAYSNPKEFSALIDILTDTTIEYLKGQIEHGADVVKLFDSWSGVLPEDQFYKWVILPTRRIVFELKKFFPNLPVICFPKGAGVMYKNFANEVMPDCLALDHTTPVSWAADELQRKLVLQGNLDNVLLTREKSDIKAASDVILNRLSGKNFIFNLGHGVLPNTKIENVEYLIDLVHNYKSGNINNV